MRRLFQRTPREDRDTSRNDSREESIVNDQHFWLYLLNISESLGTLEADSEESKQRLLEYLETVEEVFNKSFDPVDEFEKYSALALCKSIKRVLTADTISAAQTR